MTVGNLIYNNLGGVGPAFGDPEELRYGPTIQTDEGRDVDLVVTVASGDYFVADDYATFQGANEDFGSINVRDASTAHLSFEFRDSETDELTEISNFIFTLVDIDQNKNEGRHGEKLCVNSDLFSQYVVTTTTTLQISEDATTCEGGSGGSWSFESSAAGFACDNPTDASFLKTITCEECDQCASNPNLEPYFPIDQSDRAVMFVSRQPRSAAPSGNHITNDASTRVERPIAPASVTSTTLHRSGTVEFNYEIPCDDCSETGGRTAPSGTASSTRVEGGSLVQL